MVLESEAVVVVSAAPEAGHNDTAPWHAAVGMPMARFKELPHMYCYFDTTGHKVVEEGMHQKHNSMLEAMSGPTDESNWVIKHALCVGSYPYGKARKVGRQAVPPLAIGQFVATGFTHFLCLMEDEEIAAFESERGLPPFSHFITEEHEKIRKWLKGNLVKTESALLIAKKLVATCPRYNVSDLRYAEARAELYRRIAAERVAQGEADEARRAMGWFRDKLEVHFHPMKTGEAPTPDDMLSIARGIEKALRNGEKVLVFSQQGHGRACESVCVEGHCGFGPACSTSAVVSS